MCRLDKRKMLRSYVSETNKIYFKIICSFLNIVIQRWRVTYVNEKLCFQLAYYYIEEIDTLFYWLNTSLNCFSTFNKTIITHKMHKKHNSNGLDGFFCTMYFGTNRSKARLHH